MAPEQIERAIPTGAIKPDLVPLFNQYFRSFQEAASRVGQVIDRYYSINGETIRLRFAGQALLPLLTPALAHLSTSKSEMPSLSIGICDYASTGAPSPQLPPVIKIRPRGDVPGFADGQLLAHLGADLFSALDVEKGLGFYWCRDAAQLPLYEKGAPLRSIFHWWFRRSGLQLVHAGAVGKESGGVLLAGKGGSGKSTTCLTCLNSDLLYISDDYSFISLKPTPTVHTLYNTAKVRPDNLNRVPQLQDKIYNAGQLQSEKALFFLHQYFPEKIAANMPLRAILLPRVTGLEDTIITPASARDSLSALLLSTMHQLAGSNEKTVATIKQLVDMLPSFHLELGSDLEQIPVIIMDLLRKEGTKR